MSGDTARATRAGGAMLVVVAGTSPTAAFDCLTLDAAEGVLLDRQVVAPGGSFSGPVLRPEATILILPGMDVQVRRLEAEARTEAQARTAAQMLFQADGAETDGLHIAVGPPTEGARRLVVGIDRQRLAAWLDACGRAGLQPKAVHVDCLVRPVEARTIDVLVAADRTIVSAGALGGFAIDPGLAPALIGPWLKQSGLEGAALRVAGAEAGAFRAGAVQGALRIDAGEILARAACAPAASSPDVRQGAFAARDSAKPAWGAWRLAGILVVLAVMAQAATLGVQGWRDGEAARRTLAEAEREFRAVRPDVKRIVNLRAQVKALANAAAGVDRHPVLRASAPLTETLKAHPRVQLDELHYQGAGAQVVMRLSGPDAAALDAAAADLRGRGLGVVAGAAAAQSLTGGATLDLTVEAP